MGTVGVLLMELDLGNRKLNKAGFCYIDMEDDKDILEDDKDILEDDKDILEDDEDILEDDEDSDESGIFDEDFEGVEEILEGISDFSIGSTMLSTAPLVHGWQGQNLEEALDREWVEKDWGTEEELTGGDLYNGGSSGDLYGGKEGNSENLYGGTQISNLYNGGSSGDVYNSVSGASGDLYETGGKKNAGVDYNIGGSQRVKGWEEARDSRRKGRSPLETAGFEDKDKKDRIRVF